MGSVAGALKRGQRSKAGRIAVNLSPLHFEGAKLLAKEAETTPANLLRTLLEAKLIKRFPEMFGVRDSRQQQANEGIE
jgi:hypothetical protein